MENFVTSYKALKRFKGLKDIFKKSLKKFLNIFLKENQICQSGY
jgi:hypothetical protein